MKLLAVFAGILLVVNASTDKEQWESFKRTHGKTYKSLIEERTRFGIFQNNLRTIEEHNARYDRGETSYYLGVTRVADMTKEEFKAMLERGLKRKPQLNATIMEFPENLQVPDAIDWTTKGAVLPVRSQEDCGSCWAFSAVGALEGQNAIIKKNKSPLSPQQLLDCSKEYGNGDCSEGGDQGYGYNYVRDHGIEPESAYPYEARDLSCRYNAKKVILKIKGFNVLTPQKEDELKKAVGTIGPISISMAFDHLGFYQGGIFDDPNCPTDLNHGLLAVGYGQENGIKFWKIKNSWGPLYGEQGYLRIKRDAGNMCAVATECTYPVL